MNFLKTILTMTLAISALGLAQASAGHKPDYCAIDHDHRSHDASYYDYYDSDKYYRAGEYRRSRSDTRYGYSGRNDRSYRHDDGYGRRDRYYRPRSRVVSRQHYATRWNARITLVEEIYWTRSGRQQLVCSIVVRGRQAHHVSHRRLERIAYRDCSRRARIQYL